MNWSVLLMAHGGPDSLEDVKPYLLDVRRGRDTPQHLIQEVTERYARIGGKSPLLEITRRQANALENLLNGMSGNDGNHFEVFVGMRHWRPYIQDAVKEISRVALKNIVTICMTPYYSRMSIGAYEEKLEKAIASVYGGDVANLQVHKIGSWFSHPLLIQAFADRLKQGFEKFSDHERQSVHVVFSAHSLPTAILQQADPYPEQFHETARLVAQKCHLPADCWEIAYQSAGASSVKWLEPSLIQSLDRLQNEGVKNILLAPIGFVCDHVEILYDIDIEAKQAAFKRNLHLERTESLNESPVFIQALADMILQKI